MIFLRLQKIYLPAMFWAECFESSSRLLPLIWHKKVQLITFKFQDSNNFALKLWANLGATAKVKMNNVQGIFELAWKALVSGITSNRYFHVGYDLVLQVLQHLWLRRQAAPSGRLSWWCIFIHHNTVLHPESLTVRQTNINMSTNQSPLTFPSQYHCQFLFTSYGIRSSLGEYHKDSRNLKRLKDSSEFFH